MTDKSKNDGDGENLWGDTLDKLGPETPPADQLSDFTFKESPYIISGIEGHKAIALRDVQTDEAVCPECREIEAQANAAALPIPQRCPVCQADENAYPENLAPRVMELVAVDRGTSEDKLRVTKIERAQTPVVGVDFQGSGNPLFHIPPAAAEKERVRVELADAGVRFKETAILRLSHAEPIGDQDTCTLHVIVDQPLPAVRQDLSNPQYFRLLADIYDDQACKLAAALQRTLPGGTFDRLVAHLLLAKASHFRVAHDGAERATVVAVCGTTAVSAEVKKAIHDEQRAGRLVLCPTKSEPPDLWRRRLLQCDEVLVVNPHGVEPYSVMVRRWQ